MRIEKAQKDQLQALALALKEKGKASPKKMRLNRAINPITVAQPILKLRR